MASAKDTNQPPSQANCSGTAH